MLGRSKLVSGVVRVGQLFAAASLLTYCSGSDRNFQESEQGGHAGAGKSNSGGASGRGGDKGAGGASKGGQSSSASGGDESSGGVDASGGATTGSGGTATGNGGDSPMGGASNGLGGATALGGQTAAGGSANGGTAPAMGGAPMAMGGTAATSGGTTTASGGKATGSGGTVAASGGSVATSGGMTGSGGAACTSRCNETGTACTTSNQCKSGWCVDGLCCESACSGQCQACKGTSTGAADGLCAPIKRGTDPDNECALADASTCGQTGMCNGSGGCALYDTTTVCKAASCSSGSAKSSQMCDGAGVCKAATATACTPYICGTSACLTACTKNTDCSSGNVCVASKCQAPSPLLGACDETADCGKGECIASACGLYIKSIRITGTAVPGGGDPHSSLDGWFKTDANGHNLVRVSSIPQGMRLWDDIDLSQNLTSPLPPNNYLLLTDAESSNALTRNFQFNLSDGTSIAKSVQASSSSEIVLLEGTGDPFMLFQWTGADVKVLAKVY